MTPAPVSIKCFTANPERGATRAYVPHGTATAKSVLTTALPLAGTNVSSALHTIIEFCRNVNQQELSNCFPRKERSRSNA